jgi:hypothetical protein
MVPPSNSATVDESPRVRAIWPLLSEIVLFEGGTAATRLTVTTGFESPADVDVDAPM